MTNGSNCSWSDDWGGRHARGLLTQLYFWPSLLFAVLSMAGSSSIVALYARVKDIRSPGRRLLVFLSVADFLTAAGNLAGLCWFALRTDLASDWSSPETDMACQVQAAWSTFSSISSFSWSVVIAVNIFVTAVRGSDYVTRRLAVLSHFLCWGMGITIVTITASQGQFGYDQCTIYWCWVRRQYGDANSKYNGSNTFIWQLVTGKAYEVLTVAITVVLFFLSWRRIHRQSQQAAQWPSSNWDTDTTYKYASRKLLFVPLVFIISRIFGIVRFVLNAANMSSFPSANDQNLLWIVSEYMAPLQGMGDSSQGLLNCLVFIFTTRAIRKLMRDRVPQWMLPRQNSTSQLASERSSLIGAMQPRVADFT